MHEPDITNGNGSGHLHGNGSGRSDADLLEEFSRTGSPAVFGELYRRYMPLVYGLCLKYLGSRDDAEDAVMQIFEDLVHKVNRFEIKDFKTWLWSVARNHCLGKLRREKHTARFIGTERIMETAAVVHLLSEGDDEATFATLEGCIEKLPEAQREAIRRFFFDKQSYSDIAEATAQDIKSVKSYIQNGKRNLKICLERHGIEL